MSKPRSLPTPEPPAEAIARLVREAPPLTPDKIARLRPIFAPAVAELARTAPDKPNGRPRGLEDGRQPGLTMSTPKENTAGKAAESQAVAS